MSPRREPDPLNQPKVMAFAGCWHANQQWALRAIRYAADAGVETIVHTGDFGYRFHEEYLQSVDRQLQQHAMMFLFTDGNHEDHRFLGSTRISSNGLRRLTQRIWHVPRGARWTWAGRTWLGLGGAHSVDGALRRRRGLLWQPQETVTEREAARVVADGRADVLISHDCPDGVPIPGLEPDRWDAVEIMRAQEHRQRLRSVVDRVRPGLVVHGHYHVRYATVCDLGYGTVRVHGLDRDQTAMDQNMLITEVEQLCF